MTKIATYKRTNNNRIANMGYRYDNQIGLNPVIVSGWTVSAWQDERQTRPYSKAYHRKYGPTTIVDARYMVFRKKGKKDITIKINGWRGNWALNALCESGIIKFPDNNKDLDIRLHKAYSVRLLGVIEGVQIYGRFLGLEFVDYCAVLDGVTYHGSDPDNCVYLLRSKIEWEKKAAEQAKIDKKEKTVDLKFVRDLGFCMQGITEFCRTFDLDTRKSYRPTEIETAIRSKPESITPFIREVRLLARVTGIRVPEFAEL
jgi:hypothetical protein